MGVQDLLNAAAELKATLLKARPGRQEWVRAPDFMRNTARSSDAARRARKEGFSIQHSVALQLKEQGNDFVRKDPATALERYTDAISIFIWFDRGPDKASEDIPLRGNIHKLPANEQEQAHHVLSVAFCNAAACLLQLKRPDDAAYACSKALEYDPYSVKALYRRALAHRESDSREGLEAAVADLAAANQLEPANHQVRIMLAALKGELAQQRRKDMALYGGMFGSGALYGSPPAADAAGGPASGDHTAGHDGGGGFDDDDDDGALGANKASSSDADAAFRDLERNLVRAQHRKAAGQAARSARQLGAFPWWAVPWWAYALILTHLAYRLVKDSPYLSRQEGGSTMWRLSLPPGAEFAAAAASAGAASHDAQEL